MHVHRFDESEPHNQALLACFPKNAATLIKKYRQFSRLSWVTNVSRTTMPLDIEKYRHYVAGFDLSPEEQAELIRNVWLVLESFVDQAYGRHPHQHRRSDLEVRHLQNQIEFLESDTRGSLDETPSRNHDPYKH